MTALLVALCFAALIALGVAMQPIIIKLYPVE